MVIGLVMCVDIVIEEHERTLLQHQQCIWQVKTCVQRVEIPHKSRCLAF